MLSCTLVGRLIDAIHELPDADNNMIIYIVGDNGASSEGGQEGTLNEGHLETALVEAKEKNWIVVDIKHNFKRIFIPF